jgi:hypothetical protein
MIKLSGVVFTFVGIFGVLYAINMALMIPDVHFSYSNDVCVEVINYNPEDNYSCENLPNKFNHVWVK